MKEAVMRIEPIDRESATPDVRRIAKRAGRFTIDEPGREGGSRGYALSWAVENAPAGTAA
jgi:hypothetical protein